MNLTNQRAIPVGQQQAWEALNDIALLRSTIPGCETIEELNPGEYEITLAAAIGPIRAKFKGGLMLTDMQPPVSYVMNFEGKSGIAGHGKGTAAVRLEAVSPDETVIHYDVSAAIGGKIAQIGARLVSAAAQKIANEFFDRFSSAVGERSLG